MARRTSLYNAHVRWGGKIVDFAGWDLPVQFKGLVEEHQAVRQRAGIFDVSHMGEIVFEGPGALESANELITQDLNQIVDGQAVYSPLTNERAGFVDDVIAYRFSPEKILFCVNGANVEKDFAWMYEKARILKPRNESDDWSQVAVQGPKAIETIQKLTSFDLSKVPFFYFAEMEIAGRKVIFARTGYTGEDGCEIFVRHGDAEHLWESVLEAGKPVDLLPCGLGARDTLRLEAKLSLYGNDIDDDHTPLEALLGWTVKLDKSYFIGKDVLVKQKAEGVQRKLIGFVLTGRGIPRHGYPILKDGQKVGEVTSGTMSPTLNLPIGIGYVPTALAAVDSTFDIEIRGKPVPAKVVKTPFYKRPA